jgi:hypothetical protein
MILVPLRSKVPEKISPLVSHGLRIGGIRDGLFDRINRSLHRNVIGTILVPGEAPTNFL